MLASLRDRGFEPTGMSSFLRDSELRIMELDCVLRRVA
jgi:hypothetical protein